MRSYCSGVKAPDQQLCHQVHQLGAKATLERSILRRCWRRPWHCQAEVFARLNQDSVCSPACGCVRSPLAQGSGGSLPVARRRAGIEAPAFACVLAAARRSQAKVDHLHHECCAATSSALAASRIEAASAVSGLQFSDTHRAAWRRGLASPALCGVQLPRQPPRRIGVNGADTGSTSRSHACRVGRRAGARRYPLPQLPCHAAVRSVRPFHQKRQRAPGRRAGIEQERGADAYRIVANEHDHWSLAVMPGADRRDVSPRPAWRNGVCVPQRRGQCLDSCLMTV